jgi:hypothetical protein
MDTFHVAVKKRVGLHRNAIALAKRFRQEGNLSTAAFMLTAAADYRKSLKSLLLRGYVL